MNRDLSDLTHIPGTQQACHERLVEWARWCGSGRGGRDTHPMFRQYVPYLYPEVSGGAPAVDVVKALAVQRAYVVMADKHRAALKWYYCYPFISPGRVQRQLAMTRDALAQLVIDSRFMIWNTIRAQSNSASAVLPACAGRPD
jgi:hypothetical protein